MLGIGPHEEGTAGADRPGVPLQVDHVHPFPTGEAIGEARGAAWCAAELAGELRAAGLDEQDGWPVFDLLFLGIGPDGHLLSVFPGSPALDSSDLALAIPAPTHIEPRIERVTLNPAMLAVAREVLVVAYGEDKAAGLAHGPRRGARPAPLARPARQAPGGDLDPRRGCRIPAPALTERRPDGRAGPGHRVARRHADRRLHVRTTARRSSSSTARPATTRRSVSSARCSALGGPSTRWIDAAGAPRATRCRTPSSASSRTSPRSPTRWRPTPARAGRRRRALVRRALGARAPRC